MVFSVLLAVSVLTVGYGAATASNNGSFENHLNESGAPDMDAQIAPESDGITVVAADSNQWEGNPTEGHRATSELVAFNPDGTTLYFNGTHDRYWDVDPVPGTEATVEYAFSHHYENGGCPTEWDAASYGVDQETWDHYERVHGTEACTLNGVERVNLKTGEVTTVWTQFTPGKEASRYHDVDRLDENRLVVADIYLDRVFVVNTETNETEWTWNATEVHETSSGGPYPKDWTHINDVEILDDGRIMVDMRNHDEIIFLNDAGAIEDMTLGADDNHNILYEQHNPDYIPPNRGGPAVIVADSENNRVVEYQRENGEWKQTWLWQDARMQWPRDADRLPNGNTLITDSNADRVFEVDQRGNIVWSVNIAFPYEAERLGTGDESAGGESATALGLESHSSSMTGKALIGLKSLIPGKYLNGLIYITPVWMGFVEILGLLVGVLAGLAWAGAEVRWAIRDRRTERGHLSSE
ncbi:arylsulfotransferase (asst) [Haladaptatus sp. DYSN1]|uniref:arylsulfotransferase (asst) n=1 Tax=unclassified Haladaptatus TaxID=2622732 RepID=UPI0024069E83|nr:arylsulfotransferase (asst) [Haladaptatus sp. DYSN1]